MNLESLSNSERQAFILSIRYMASRSSKSYCFTYRGLRSWIHYNPDIKPKPEWHTIERAIRSLAEKGVYKRVRKGKTVIFCPGREFFSLKYSYLKTLKSVEPKTNEVKSIIEFLESSD